MTLFQAFGQFAGSGGVAGPPGLVLLTPTSITNSGGSASIGANGGITFSGISSIAVNGVFSATYDNYVIVIRHQATANSDGVFRFRASGTDTTTNYNRQTLRADGSTISGFRGTAQSEFYAPRSSDVARSGATLYIYRPFLSLPTSVRVVQVSGQSSAFNDGISAAQTATTSFDGFSIAANLTGAMQIYGVRK